jgi:hypothetical protein
MSRRLDFETNRRLEPLKCVSGEGGILPLGFRLAGIDYRSRLFFLLQSPIVFLDECADLICHAQKLFPLLAIERDRKTS